MNPVIVTTSWDDGHVFDLKLADLLSRYALPGTFYVCPKHREFQTSELLTKAQVYDLSRTFEIGAHTITHPELPTIPLSSAKDEIVDSKHILEDITQCPVEMFCYPRGKFNDALGEVVQEAGYRGARTVQRFQHEIPDEHYNPYQMPTTIHAYSHYTDIPAIAKLTRFNPVRMTALFAWDKVAQELFDQILQTGGIFHLWGHSWEVEARHEWEQLEQVFRYIAQRVEVTYLSNAEVLEYFQPVHRQQGV